MPTEAIRSAVFQEQQGTATVDGATSNSGFTALQDTRTQTLAGNISTSEITSALQLHHENGLNTGHLSSHIKPAQDKTVQNFSRKNLSLQPGCLPVGGNFLTRHSKDLASATNSLNSGHDFTAGPCMQQNVSKKSH